MKETFVAMAKPLTAGIALKLIEQGLGVDDELLTPLLTMNANGSIQMIKLGKDFSRSDAIRR